MSEDKEKKVYRGRIAPTPSGYLHEGHAKTFKIAWTRARMEGGTIVYRNDDLDRSRCKKIYLKSAMEDLRKLKIDWDEGPDIGGEFGPYNQSERGKLYREAILKLAKQGFIYPCMKSRKEIQNFGLKSKSGEEYLFPEKFRGENREYEENEICWNISWRFRADWGKTVNFYDQRLGNQIFETGIHFSDFLVWRKDGTASYELATVIDDIHMSITEIVRGEDLLISSARQNLLFDAFGSKRPSFYHCKLMLDSEGNKLSKSTRTLPSLFRPS